MTRPQPQTQGHGFGPAAAPAPLAAAPRPPPTPRPPAAVVESATIEASTATPVEAVRGRVVDPGGRAVSGAAVRCGDVTTTSDEDGGGSLGAEDDGCEATAHHEDYATSPPRTLRANEDMVLQLGPAGEVRGRVQTQTGTPVSAFSLAIESFAPADRASGAPASFLRRVEDDDGRFTWRGLAAGTYVIAAATEGSPPARASVTVVPGEEDSSLLLVLPPARVLAGRVVDVRSGEPLPDVHVALELSPTLRSHRAPDDGDAWPSAQTRTDPDGHFSLEGVPEEECTLRLYREGYRSKRVPVAPHRSVRRRPGQPPPGGLSVTLTPGTGFESVGVGVGLHVAEDGALRILAVLPDSPASRAGIVAGDRVLRIDDVDVETLGLFGALRGLWGPPDSTVRMALKPKDGEPGETIDLLPPHGLPPRRPAAAGRRARRSPFGPAALIVEYNEMKH